eukprot:EG_transcript_35636
MAGRPATTTSAPDLSQQLKWLDTCSKEDAQAACAEASGVAHHLAREAAATLGHVCDSVARTAPAMLRDRDALTALTEQTRQRCGDVELAIAAVRDIHAIPTFTAVLLALQAVTAPPPSGSPAAAPPTALTSINSR